MTDQNPPYEKAIEETAKATNNAVDLIREGGRAISPAIADIYGLLIGDKVRAARVKNLDEINDKRRKILEGRGVDETVQPPEDVAIPILEAAQGETREEMQLLWARLLANAMDPKRMDDVRPEFIEIVRRLQPIDAIILKVLHDYSSDHAQVTHLNIINAVRRRDDAVGISIDHLARLQCVLSLPTGYIKISPYGKELMIALAP